HTALIVAEAMHDSAPSDVPELIAAVVAELTAVWSITPVAAVLSHAAPRCTSGEYPGAVGLRSTSYQFWPLKLDKPDAKRAGSDTKMDRALFSISYVGINRTNRTRKWS